ncbi:MAG: lysylphosphatidylglycerol synthase transmembrane domain-containing protein [Anaerolineales bacterium]|nr:lysylphosphatidylglycerol synthase transmembrane domain-containing protein [Anaerolineales bacterium]
MSRVSDSDQRKNQAQHQGGTVESDRPIWRQLWIRLLIWLAVVILLWFVIREVDLRSLWQAVGHLSALEIGALLLVNLIALSAMSLRWWIVVRAFGHRLSLFRAIGYRLAAFSVSYFTPGPHFGGEPLQVHLLKRRLKLRGTQSAATVALDKSIELVANFSFLLLGLTVLLGLGVFPSLSPVPVLTLAAGLLALPMMHLIAAARGHRPLAGIIRRLPPRVQTVTRVNRLTALLAETEGEVVRFLRERTGWFVATLVASGVTWAVFVTEYWLMSQFLGIRLTGLEAIAALTAARVAFLLPMPGGLGALEASQVLAVSALGHSAAAGAALALVIRARDLIFGGIGLVIGGLATGKSGLASWKAPGVQEESL